MGMTFFQIYECKDCGYVFEGLSGIQGFERKTMRHISPCICNSCGNMKNVVHGYSVSKDAFICEKCNSQVEFMDKKVVYECPKCHKKSLKCVDEDSVYSKNQIYIY